MGFSGEGLKDLHASMHGSLDIFLDHAASVPWDVLAKQLDGFGYPSVLAQLSHLLSTESAWVCGLQLLPLVTWKPDSFASIEDLRVVKTKVMAETVRYLDSIGESQLNTEIERCPKEWVGPRRAPSFILLHVITHAFHHKGQVVAMMRLLGYPAPDTDMQRA